MRRGNGAQLARLARDIARREGQSAADLGRPGVDDGSARSVGQTDETTGAFVAFGRLDLTTFGEGFKLS